ncbi:hypothetical protein RRG08_049609 [Elysia crispata]|uniref:Uncharacterized protein n=1 Tax=Elysia crispata TaxID=231223 RepID=A0AAE1AUZ5_9GAST|nr:hypothetical protein RRG08_049609 [Elysia crispata]
MAAHDQTFRQSLQRPVISALNMAAHEQTFRQSLQRPVISALHMAAHDQTFRQSLQILVRSTWLHMTKPSANHSRYYLASRPTIFIGDRTRLLHVQVSTSWNLVAREESQRLSSSTDCSAHHNTVMEERYSLGETPPEYPLLPPWLCLRGAVPMETGMPATATTLPLPEVPEAWTCCGPYHFHYYLHTAAMPDANVAAMQISSPHHLVHRRMHEATREDQGSD